MNTEHLLSTLEMCFCSSCEAAQQNKGLPCNIGVKWLMSELDRATTRIKNLENQLKTPT